MPGKASGPKKINLNAIPFMDDGEKISKMNRPSIAIAISQFAKITVHEMMKGNKDEKCKIIHIEL
jgi:hypothetical protein